MCRATTRAKVLSSNTFSERQIATKTIHRLKTTATGNSRYSFRRSSSCASTQTMVVLSNLTCMHACPLVQVGSEVVNPLRSMQFPRLLRRTFQNSCSQKSCGDEIDAVPICLLSCRSWSQETRHGLMMTNTRRRGERSRRVQTGVQELTCRMVSCEAAGVCGVALSKSNLAEMSVSVWLGLSCCCCCC